MRVAKKEGVGRQVEVVVYQEVVVGEAVVVVAVVEVAEVAAGVKVELAAEIVAAGVEVAGAVSVVMAGDEMVAAVVELVVVGAAAVVTAAVAATEEREGIAVLLAKYVVLSYPYCPLHLILAYEKHWCPVTLQERQQC